MTHQRLWVASAIIALVLVVGFVLSVPHTRDVIETMEVLPEAENVASITLRDAFKKGTRTITGSLETPNACASVTAEASIAGSASSTQSILVAISIVKDEGVCLQLPATKNFSVTISAPARLPITATINGVAVTTDVL